MPLFQRGNFTLHSGGIRAWKIECDALTAEDWAAAATMVAERIRFRQAIPVLRGGGPFAKALAPYATGAVKDPWLIVDDVLTTGQSMEWARARAFPRAVVEQERSNTVGVVLFARGACPDWVQPVFQFS